MLNQLFVVKLREKEILTREEISSIFANIPTLQDMHLELFKVLGWLRLHECLLVARRGLWHGSCSWL
jgi:hypothetical protein